MEILRRVSGLLTRRKARLVNVDATIAAEVPKLSPHIGAMRKKIANAVDTSEFSISIKATTNETLGAIGRGEGIAAIAIATVEVE